MTQLLLAVALLLAAGLLLSGALSLSHATRTRMARRFALVRDTHTLRVSGRPAMLDAAVARVRTWLAIGLEHRWAMRAPLSLLCGAGMAGGATMWLLLRVMANLPVWPVLACSLIASFAAPRALLKRQQAKAELAFLDTLPDAIDTMVRMLRAGVPVGSIMRSIGDDAPVPIDRVFHHLADRLNLGMPFGEAMQVAGEDIGLADFRAFAMAVALHGDTGGNLTATLDVLARIIRRRREARLKARSATAEVRLTACILGALPFLITGMLAVTNPRYMVPLAQDPRGHVILGAALVMLVLGLLALHGMMRRATNVWQH
jgi:tight adherence protein B